MERLITATALLTLTAIAAPVPAQTLRGSRTSVETQHRVAVEHDYTFISSTGQVKRFTSAGYLVAVPGNADYELAGVSFPFARPAVKTFIERLSHQYRTACGERLVVTSLTRPTTRQPRNASDQSVHPAGMAADLRISRSSKCRAWIERVLLELERKGVLEATRERFPAHYHVAVFPNPYLVYIGRLAPENAARRVIVAEPEPESAPVEEPAAADNGSTDATAETGDPTAGGVEAASADMDVVEAVSAPSVADDPPAPGGILIYRVNRGDTLWDIARRHGTSVAELQELNALQGNGIRPGQRIKVRARTN